MICKIIKIISKLKLSVNSIYGLIRNQITNHDILAFKNHISLFEIPKNELLFLNSIFWLHDFNHEFIYFSYLFYKNHSILKNQIIYQPTFYFL